VREFLGELYVRYYGELAPLICEGSRRSLKDHCTAGFVSLATSGFKPFAGCRPKKNLAISDLLKGTTPNPASAACHSPRTRFRSSG